MLKAGRYKVIQYVSSLFYSYTVYDGMSLPKNERKQPKAKAAAEAHEVARVPKRKMRVGRPNRAHKIFLTPFQS
jgi:hypothetical protein